MADVRAMLKNERTARKIQHKHASYATGTLLCIVCRLQLKSDVLWEGHLRSAGHIMRLEKLEESREAPSSTVDSTAVPESNNKKRKATEDDEIGRKRPKATNGSPEELSDTLETLESDTRPIKPLKNTIQIPSRPATPMKSAETKPKLTTVDEDEWAAFEADIAATAAPVIDTFGDGVISAPAMSAAEVAAKDKEEEDKRKRERQDAELEGDKEDAARRMEDELEEIEGLEQRVKKLKEMRETLRSKNKAGLAGARAGTEQAQSLPPIQADEEEDDEDADEDDDEYEDDWGGFMSRS